MRKSITILLFFTILFSFLLVSCTDSDGNFEDIKNVTFDYDTTPYLDEAVIRMENFSFQFLDCLLVPADDYGENDCLMIRDLLEDIIIIKPSFLKLVVGAYKSVGGDGYLLMLLNFDPEEDLAERGPFEPRMKIQAIDNFGEEAVLMYNSLHKSTVDAEFPYGILIFKANYDADTIFFMFDDQKFKLDFYYSDSDEDDGSDKNNEEGREEMYLHKTECIHLLPARL
jgi:hypothetical protein